MITNIKIENIKGFGTANNSFDLEIKSQKVNILVAPNGFGKSSITAAFNSLAKGKIKVEETDMHQKDTTLIPSLSIVLDGVTLIANPTTNTINKEITCFIINNRLKVQTVSKTFGGFSTTKGFLSIDSIKVVDSIPQKVSDLYKYSDAKMNFGVNGKILPNLSDYFSQNDFLERIQFSFECFEKFETKKRSDLIDEIKINIQQLKGNKEEIIANIQDDFFEKIEQDEFYNKFGEIFKDITGTSLFNKFNLFYQLRYLFNYKKESLLKASRRASYDIFKNKFDRNISYLNTTWKEIS